VSCTRGGAGSYRLRRLDLRGAFTGARSYSSTHLKRYDSICISRIFVFFQVAFTDGLESVPPEETGLRAEGWGYPLGPGIATAPAPTQSLSLLAEAGRASGIGQRTERGRQAGGQGNRAGR